MLCSGATEGCYASSSAGGLPKRCQPTDSTRSTRPGRSKPRNGSPPTTTRRRCSSRARPAALASCGTAAAWSAVSNRGSRARPDQLIRFSGSRATGASSPSCRACRSNSSAIRSSVFVVSISSTARASLRHRSALSRRSSTSPMERQYIYVNFVPWRLRWSGFDPRLWLFGNDRPFAADGGLRQVPPGGADHRRLAPVEPHFGHEVGMVRRRRLGRVEQVARRELGAILENAPPEVENTALGHAAVTS